jgi:hypothetical protein
MEAASWNLIVASLLVSERAHLQTMPRNVLTLMPR